MKRIFFFLAILTILSCKKDDENNNDVQAHENTFDNEEDQNNISEEEDDTVVVDEFIETEIRQITGIALKEEAYDEPIILGNPNVKSYQVTATPNPVNDFVSIRSVFIGNYPQISDVWVIKAELKKVSQDIDFEKELEDTNFEIKNLDAIAELKISDLNKDKVLIDLTDFDPGYYKVFALMDGEQYWDNIFIQDGNTSINDLESFWK